MTTIVITAVGAEHDAIVRGLGGGDPVRIGPYDATQAGDILVVVGGVGAAAAAAAAATVVSSQGPGLLVSAGIAGAFAGNHLDAGDVALASVIVDADLGADTADGFVDLATLGLGHSEVGCDLQVAAQWRDHLVSAGRRVVMGPVITVATVTGTTERAEELTARHGAIAEAMEGAGVAHVATLWSCGVTEVRTISNAVGARDPLAWDLQAALVALEDVAAVLWR